MIKAIFISSLVLNAGVLLGRLSGLIRESFIANVYGDSPEADVVVFMLTVPDILINILMGTTLAAVLIPAFAKNREQAKKILFQAVLLVGIISCFLSAILYWQSDSVVSLFAGGFTEDQRTNASNAFGYVVVLIPLTIITGGTTAYLQYKNKFALPSIGTLIMNVSIIAGLYLVFCGKGGIKLIAMFVIIGGLIRLLSQWIVSRPSINFSPWLLESSFLKHYGRAMLTGSILIIFPVITKRFASDCGEGAYATMNYVFKLVNFPISIAVTVVTTALFPRLVASLQSDSKSFTLLFRYGLQANIALSCVVATTLYAVSTNYAALVYEHGNMGESSIQVIGGVTAIGLLSLPFQGIAVFVTAIFFAMKNTTTPLVINVVGLGFLFFLSYFEVLGKGLDSLMLAYTISYGCICLFGLVALHLNGIRSIQTIFQIKFFVPLLFALGLLFGAVVLIERAEFGAHLAVLLALMSGLISLLLLTLLHHDCRTAVFRWIRARQ